MNLVAGATGRLGSEVCRLLADKGKPVRALVRSTSDPAIVEELEALGAEVVRGNLCDTASHEEACKGVDAVISTVSSMPVSYQPGANDIQTVDVEGVSNLITAAQKAGVRHFIYTSFSGQIDLESPLRNAKRAVEQRLKDSGMAYTILRPTCFMEAWLGPGVGFDYPTARVQIYGTGQGPISWISSCDVARFAVESLGNPAARNATLELGGPEALSPLQAVRIFEEVGGKPFEVQHIAEEALQAQKAGATDPMQESFAALMLGYAQGDAIDMEKTMGVFSFQLTTVRDYAKAAVAGS